MTTRVRTTQVADGVFFAQGPDVNWVLLRDGTDVTMIDAGYPGYGEEVVASLTAIGSRPEDVQAILITHAHVDHIGVANSFHRHHGTPCYLDPVEVAHAHRDHLEQAAPADVAKRILKPGVAPWSFRIMKAGAMKKDVAIVHAQPFPGDGPLDLPGHPAPVATHGHTSGHSAYHLAGVGVVVTGDGLVTGHAISLQQGPQLLPAFFNHGDADAALDALAPLAADVVLPGHGGVHHGRIAEAVATARRRQRPGSRQLG